MPKKWFQNWFSSPYYHILYHQRNDEEAEFFIDNLCAFLKPAENFQLLDIACGRGRHSVYLNKKGYDVTGIDLSNASIKFAQQFENENLQFYVHDMRYTFYINYFNIAFNLFTSFGYFETEKDHVKALKAFHKSLKKSGILVLDYFNSEKIMRNLAHQEVKHVDGIDFYISKKIANGKIIKSISFEHKNKDFAFKEEVKAFTKGDFERMFEKSGFKILNHFGDYALNPFDENKSDRLIFICQKDNA
ncbi:Methyltransferase domain-containing protein [Daejeonella rubra]|uniref:Methyltransferase domain-containing protein n=1 Tax=Daejeonella rubra TaxID=990371 RepID=A0A1G9QGK0_9SPHI|nr:class I SAM-dependent methyltransferase [Daejeonella rubra]SDM10182.1 Methyltransferase domain-containing protein [Daejeonella rubra]